MSAWDKGSPSGWKQLRAYVLDRDHHRCQLHVSPRCQGVATQVHHKLGASITGILCSPDLLTSACFNCNRYAGEPTNQRFEIKVMTQW